MKKLVLGFSILFLFLFAANTAHAQLTFYNSTPCAVRVMGVYTYSATPCTAGPYCSSVIVGVPAFGSAVIPAGACPPMAFSAAFVKVGVWVNSSTFYGVSICGSGSTPATDCNGNPRTLLQPSPNTAYLF